MKMFDGDGVFAQRATHTTAGLKKPKGQARNPTRPLGDFGQDCGIQRPPQANTAKANEFGEFFVRVKLKPQDKPHSVSQRLQKVRLVRRGQQQGEIGEGNCKRRAARSAVHHDLLLVQSHVHGDLKRRVEFGGLVDEDDCLVLLGRQEQGIDFGKVS